VNAVMGLHKPEAIRILLAEVGREFLDADVDCLHDDFVKRMLSEHRSGRTNYAFFLWSLLNLTLWYEHWIAAPRTSSEVVESPTAKEVAIS
jgi:hypothetical protein